MPALRPHHRAACAKRGEGVRVPCILHDIDTEDVKEADEAAKKHGDWTPDYLIPQVFFEIDDGRIEHVLTGIPRPSSIRGKPSVPC